MKIRLLLIIAILSATAFGQYEIRQSTIDGGGRTSSGGSYTLRGTIGQPDAGDSAGGQYELLGGFWESDSFCVVDFEHFARFAQHWLETGPGLPADLHEDNIVDKLDLSEFVYEWLYYCPYNWPLR